MWLSIYTIAQLLILHKSLFFQDDKRKCNDLQTGCVNYFLLSGEKKNVCISIVYLQDESLSDSVSVSRFRGVLLTIGF